MSSSDLRRQSWEWVRNATGAELTDLHHAAHRLVVALEDEEREHGFPFNFDARDALRDLRESLA